MAKRKQADIQSATTSQSPQRSTQQTNKRGKSAAPIEPSIDDNEKARSTRAKSTATGASKVQSKGKAIGSKGVNPSSNTKLKQTNPKSNNNTNSTSNNNNNKSTKKLPNISSNSNKTNRTDDNGCPPTRPSRPTNSNQQQKRLKDNNCAKQDSSVSSLTPSTSATNSNKTQTKTAKTRADKSDNSCKVQQKSTQKSAKTKSKSVPKAKISEQIIESFSNDSNKSDELFGELMQQQMEGMDEDTKRIQEAEAALRSLTGDIDVNTEETDTEDVEEADKPMFENLFAKKESQNCDKDNRDCAANAWKDVVTLSASSSSCGSMSETSPQHSPPVTPENADQNINSPAESRASVSTINESTDQTIEEMNNQNNEDELEEETKKKSYDEMENLMKIEEHCNAFMESNKSDPPVATHPEDNQSVDDSDDDDEDSSDDTEDESPKDNQDVSHHNNDRNMDSSPVLAPIVTQMAQTSQETSVCQRRADGSPPIARPFIKEEDMTYAKTGCCLEASQQNRIIKAQLQQPFLGSSAHSQAFSSGFKPKAPEHKYFDCKYQKSMSETMSSMSCHSPLNAYMSTRESSNETNIGICHQNLLPTSTAGPHLMSAQYPEDETMTSASNLSFPGSPPNGLYPSLPKHFHKHWSPLLSSTYRPVLQPINAFAVDRQESNAFAGPDRWKEWVQLNFLLCVSQA